MDSDFEDFFFGFPKYKGTLVCSLLTFKTDANNLQFDPDKLSTVFLKSPKYTLTTSGTIHTITNNKQHINKQHYHVNYIVINWFCAESS